MIQLPVFVDFTRASDKKVVIFNIDHISMMSPSETEGLTWVTLASRDLVEVEGTPVELLEGIMAACELVYQSWMTVEDPWQDNEGPALPPKESDNG